MPEIAEVSLAGVKWRNQVMWRVGVRTGDGWCWWLRQNSSNKDHQGIHEPRKGGTDDGSGFVIYLAVSIWVICMLRAEIHLTALCNLVICMYLVK